MKLKVNEEILVSDINLNDKSAFIEHLKEKQIYDQTLAIPFPYTEKDADWWINHVQDSADKQGVSTNWAIRQSDGSLIGGIGFHDIEVGKSYKSEIGYWLAKPYWNKGIMTDVVKKITDYGFKEFKLIRITAHIFYFNSGSARVLEKAGYEFEGTLKKLYKKDGKIFDGKLYAKVLCER